MKTQLLSIFTLVSFCLQAQKHFAGFVSDEAAYYAIPVQEKIPVRSALPSSYSLKKYCPTPGNQGFYLTCTAWASTYAARTIAEAVINGWTDQEQITQEAFSPLFVYAKSMENNTDCRKPSSLSKPLNTMVDIVQRNFYI